MHRRISAYIVDRSASKSTPLMYFRSISTASDVHDYFLGFFYFSRGNSSSTSFRVERSSLVLSSTIGSSSSRSFAKCRRCCPPTVPNSVRFDQHRTAKTFPGLTRALNHYRLSRQSDSNPIPQKLTLLEG